MTARGITTIFEVTLEIPEKALAEIKKKIPYQSAFELINIPWCDDGGEEDEIKKECLIFKVTTHIPINEREKETADKVRGAVIRQISSVFSGRMVSCFIPLLSGIDKGIFRYELVESKVPKARIPYKDN
jgi:hypothetical protein